MLGHRRNRLILRDQYGPEPDRAIVARAQDAGLVMMGSTGIKPLRRPPLVPELVSASRTTMALAHNHKAPALETYYQYYAQRAFPEVSDEITPAPAAPPNN